MGVAKIKGEHCSAVTIREASIMCGTKGRGLLNVSVDEAVDLTAYYEALQNFMFEITEVLPAVDGIPIIL